MSVAAPVLVLLGSPRKAGASTMIGHHLASRLEAAGHPVTRLPLTGLLQTEEGRLRLAGEAARAGLVLLASPVYVDAPPAPVMRALEFLAQGGPAFAPGARFAAAFVCGFPEPEHTEVSLGMCRLFCRRAGLDWAGGLGVGGGAMFAGQPLASRPGRSRRLRQGLDLAAEALSLGRPVPEQAKALARGPHAPRRLYLLLATLSLLAGAVRHRALGRLGRRPFVQP